MSNQDAAPATAPTELRALSILVPGGGGQLGQDLLAQANPDIDIRAPRSKELNITDGAAVAEAVGHLAERAQRVGRAPVVVNAAAYTAVDAAEDDAEAAFAVNATGPGYLAKACSAAAVPLIHVSTDYVFPGDSTVPYEPDDRRAPRSVYGRSKAAGEDAVLNGGRSWVVRTAWLYGSAGKNFVDTAIRLEREREHLSVVDDQHGSPTWTRDLAAGLLELAGHVADGNGPAQRILHCTNTGQTTWHGLAQAVFESIGADPARVRPCASEEFPRPAPRPAYSVLSNRSWLASGLTPLRSWRAALADYLSDTRKRDGSPLGTV